MAPCSCRGPVVCGFRVAGSEGRPRVGSLPGSKMDGSGYGGGSSGRARGAPLAFLGASGMVAESRGRLPPWGRETSGGGAAAAPQGAPAAAAQPLLSSHSQAAGARGPRRHGRGSRVAAAAGGGPQQGEALGTFRLQAGGPAGLSESHISFLVPRGLCRCSCTRVSWRGVPQRGKHLPDPERPLFSRKAEN